jgi:hypothetical protein
MHGLYQHQPGARSWRRYLSDNTYQHDANEQVLAKALAQRAVTAEQVQQSRSAFV